MDTYFFTIVIAIIVGALVADRAVSKGKDVRLEVSRFFKMTASSKTERPQRRRKRKTHKKRSRGDYRGTPR